MCIILFMRLDLGRKCSGFPNFRGYLQDGITLVLYTVAGVMSSNYLPISTYPPRTRNSPFIFH